MTINLSSRCETLASESKTSTSKESSSPSGRLINPNVHVTAARASDSAWCAGSSSCWAARFLCKVWSGREARLRLHCPCAGRCLLNAPFRTILKDGMHEYPCLRHGGASSRILCHRKRLAVSHLPRVKIEMLRRLIKLEQSSLRH